MSLSMAPDDHGNSDSNQEAKSTFCGAKHSETSVQDILLRLPGSRVRSALLNDGYIVMPSVFCQSECLEAYSLIWDFVEDTSSGTVCRNDRSTWYQKRDCDPSQQHALDVDPWPSCSRGDPQLTPEAFFVVNGAGWVLGNAREALAERVFSPLFDSDQLHCSKEGFMLRRPRERRGLALEDHHQRICINEHQENNQSWCIRSLLYLQDIRARSSITLEVGTNAESLHLMTGDVLLFRSDLSVHELFDRNIESSGLRAGFLCTMQPSCLTRPDVLFKKMEAYRLRATGDYRPDQEKWFHPSNQTRYGRPFYRTSPPLVSVRLAELYGLLPYSSSNYHRERALVQGVRFLPEEQSIHPKIRPCFAQMQFLCADESDSHEMMGQDKYLGGMASPCGRFVYGVPGSAKRVMRIHCQSGNIDFIGPSLPGKFKWLRGVEVPACVLEDDRYPDGCCFALPCNATSVLKVNPHDSQVSTFGENIIQNCGVANGWLYHGGNLALNGWIYAIPANASRVLKFHPITEECRLIGPDFGDGLQKWYGGIIGIDNCIYGVPHNERFVLKIDPSTDAVSLMNDTRCQSFPSGQWKWHGGLRAGEKIIGFPNNADDVLCIHVPSQRVYTISMKDDAGNNIPLKSGRHRVHKGINKYKYLGGSLTLDGRYAFLFPCDAEQVLKVDVVTNTLSLVGPLLLDGPNKFQNGFTGRDGCCYGVPQRATGVLRITPATSEEDEDHVDIIDCGSISGVKDKFEGGVMTDDGNIYCIPLRAKTCVKVVPDDRMINDDKKL